MAAPLVLLVDDDADCLELARHALQAQGYRVACCFDPEEALAGMAREKPAVVVTDLVMGRLHAGFDLVRRMAGDEALRGIPVILQTGVSTQHGFDFRPRGEADLAAMGVAAFLEKPTRPATLLATVARVLAGRGGSPATPGGG